MGSLVKTVATGTVGKARWTVYMWPWGLYDYRVSREGREDTVSKAFVDHEEAQRKAVEAATIMNGGDGS
jgi:hypothetical protein